MNAAGLALIITALVLLALLALAPRLRVFDDRRTRLIVIGVLGVLIVGGGTGLTGFASWRAGRAAAEARRELAESLDGADADALRQALDAGEGGVLPGIVRIERRGDEYAFYRPVSVIWVRWCVVGLLAADDTVRLETVRAACPPTP